MKKFLFILGLLILTSCASHYNSSEYTLDTMQPNHETGIADENAGGNSDSGN